jgi:outer membrane protein OmpA-like peptidoglycan-associated protein
LIRKQGYFNKRLEAYVNVKGCILCFDGLESVRPGIADNLTNQNSMGTLLANIELKKIAMNNGLSLNNIYYEPSSASLGKAALKELDKLIPILRDNPHVSVEIGSHTDARGDATLNLQLSQERAETVVDYLITKGELEPSRILAKGYGKTKIINQCKDGIECTEAQHKENRRTTLMVTNFDENSEANQRTLENILREEEMSRMLKEVQNQEVVAYKNEESSPETATSTKILPKETDKQATKILPTDEPFMSPDKTTVQTKSTAKVTKEATTKITAQKEIAESATKKTIKEATQATAKIKPMQEAAQKTITDAISDADAIEQEALNREGTMQAEPVEPIMRNENGQPIKKNGKSTSIKNVPPSKIKPASEGKEKIKPSDINGETVVENPIISAPTTNYANKTPNTEKNQAVAAPKTVPSKPKAHKILPSNNPNAAQAQESIAKIGALPQGFTGFSIQVGNATGDLPDSHVIFKHFKEVMVEEKKDGTKAYLVGAFQTYEDCLSYMKTNILPFFPNARTVAFKDGNWF